MPRTWMVFLFLIPLVSLTVSPSYGNDAYRNDGFEAEEPEAEPPVTVPDNNTSDSYGGGSEVTEPEPEPEPEVSPLAPQVSLRPQTKTKPRVTVEVATPEDPEITYTRDVDFTNTGKYDRQTDFFKKFQHVFKKCSGGCDAGRAHIHRPRPRYTNSAGERVRGRYTSCHHSDKAVDIHALKCNGVEYSAYTSRFKAFVNCVKGESYQGKKWKTLFRDTKAGCRGSAINHTTCHYNHAHFSLGCRVQRRNGTWKNYW